MQRAGAMPDARSAQDLAARGLDVPTIYTVVSYDAARDIETHTHRVGRTGRAGAQGEAFTLLTSEKHSRRMAAALVEHLELTGKKAGAELMAAAFTTSRPQTSVPEDILESSYCVWYEPCQRLR